jgi:hypothetical protein
MTYLPEVHLDTETAQIVDLLASSDRELISLESDLLASGPIASDLAERAADSSFVRSVRESWATHDHVIIRGVVGPRDGTSGLLLAALLFPTLRPYRRGKIVKQFRMSPWTTALSHTLAEGHFHTDVNTNVCPPVATVMQCLEPDPAAPEYGQLRVARLIDLLAALRHAGAEAAGRLLTTDEVVMVDESAPGGWSGRITDGRTIRFHPRTLVAGHVRYGTNPAHMEEYLAAIHEAALSVSVPIDLRQGDLLVVSNRRALHQRSACTVRFREFPRVFDARSVAVLHTLSEPR